MFNDKETRLCAYWHGRIETPATVADRLTTLQANWALLGDAYADWVIAENTPLPAEPALLEWLATRFGPLTSGEDARLGGVLSCLSQKRLGPSTLELSITAGINNTLPTLTNALVLVPRDDDAIEVIPDQRWPLMEAVLTSWEPDWVVVTTAEQRKAAQSVQGRKQGPFLGQCRRPPRLRPPTRRCSRAAGSTGSPHCRDSRPRR